MSIDPKKFGLSDSLVNAVNEALKGGQTKLDKNHNGKLDSQDFKMLRKEDSKQQDAVDEQSPGDYEKANFKHSMLGTDKRMKNEVADGNKANFKANMKEDETKIVAKPQYDKTRPAFTEPKKKVNEAAEQVDELSKATMGSYIKKASHDVATKSAATGRYADRANTVKDQMKKGDYSNYQQGKKDDATADKMFGKSWKRRAGIAKATDKLTKEEVVDEAAVAGNNVVADMDARKTEVQRKIAQKQASFQQSKANKRISSPTMKEAKCTCGEGKGSKMTCEVCNSDKGLKGGKEPILMNPPLKEASNLPKAVVTKGHEIAKSLIKHRSKVKEPYAVGMAAAKKSAGIKEEVVDEAVNAKKIAADHAAGHSVDVIVQKHLNKKGDNKNEILKAIRANAWNKRMNKKD